MDNGVGITKKKKIMIYARVLLAAFWKITNREIKFSYLCIPFYYWMVSQEEKKQVKRKTNIKKEKRLQIKNQLTKGKSLVLLLLLLQFL